MVTRRCSERRFFLSPSPHTNAIFLYVLGLAAARYGVEVHALCVMSNHYHLLVTDPRAVLPAFMQYLNSLVARAMNASLRRSEGFWSSETSYSAVTHGSTHDIVAKAAYVLANPALAGLVCTGRDWPGVWTAPEQLGVATLVVTRPEGFFSKRGNLPESVPLRLTVPPGFASAEEFQERVRTVTDRIEATIQRRRRAQGMGFVGRKRVLNQSPFTHPAPGRPARGLNPRVAARDRWRRMALLSRLTEFLRAYREALAARMAGAMDVVFPAGTYLLRVAHRVPCESCAAVSC
jgi:REP element-mobilizing transposase RayT